MVQRVVLFGLVVLLAPPAARGRDEPKQDPKPVSAKQQFAALVKEFSTERQKAVTGVMNAKGDDRTKAMERYTGLGKEFADKFYKLAETNPTDPAATDALFWIFQNATGYTKADDKILALIAEVPLTELTAKLPPTPPNKPKAFIEAVLKRAEKDEKDALAGELLGWVATSRLYSPGAPSPAAEQALARLIEKYPDHPALERLCRTLARGSADNADALKKIIAGASAPGVKAEATLALGQNLAAQADDLGGKPEQAEKLAGEADKALSRAVELFAAAKAADRKEAAEQELKAFRTLRVGKEAPEIAGKDLDGKEFKLSDYRGKVVLLDFWGHW